MGVVAAVAQPSGTVTLVFTDIEGSTRLLEELGTEAYREVLARHREVIREACARHAGYEVDTEGDSFFYAFGSAQAAVGAVSDAMRALEGGPIRIRVGYPHRRAGARSAELRRDGCAPGGADHERGAWRPGGAVAVDGGAAGAGLVRARGAWGASAEGSLGAARAVPACGSTGCQTRSRRSRRSTAPIFPFPRHLSAAARTSSPRSSSVSPTPISGCSRSPARAAPARRGWHCRLRPRPRTPIRTVLSGFRSRRFVTRRS